MKTVVENNVGLNKQYYVSKENMFPVADHISHERSCFYDFGARSSVEFSGFVNNGDSVFIDQIGRCFNC